MWTASTAGVVVLGAATLAAADPVPKPNPLRGGDPIGALTRAAPPSADPLGAKIDRLMVPVPRPIALVPVPAAQPASRAPARPPGRDTASPPARVAAERRNTERSGRRRVAAVPSAAPVTEGAHAARNACEARLRRAGVRFTAVPPMRQGACGIDAPIRVSAIGDVALSPPPVVGCAVSETLAGYVRGPLTAAARRHMRRRPATLKIAAGYACRRRNRQRTGRLSEHAKGRAIDIRAIHFADGHVWSVAPDRTHTRAGRAFQRALRQSACGPFTTVLGPGSDRFHDDHLHFDIAVRRNNATYCR